MFRLSCQYGPTPRLRNLSTVNTVIPARFLPGDKVISELSQVNPANVTAGNERENSTYHHFQFYPHKHEVKSITSKNFKLRLNEPENSTIFHKLY